MPANPLRGARARTLVAVLVAAVLAAGSAAAAAQGLGGALKRSGPLPGSGAPVGAEGAGRGTLRLLARGAIGAHERSCTYMLQSQRGWPVASGSSPAVVLAPFAPKVTPDGQTVSVAPNSTNCVGFWVENPNPSTLTLHFSCSVSGAVTWCAPELESFTFPPRTGRDVYVEFGVGASGSGRVTLSAGGPDSGYYNVQLPPATSPGAPSIDLSMNPGTLVDRPSCVTTGAGPAGIFQCGELLLSHSMPTFRSLGRERRLTLLYNSATAWPSPVVMADVWLPGTMAKPDSVRVVLTVNGTQSWTHWFRADSLEPGGERWRVAVAADLSGYATGVYPYRLAVANFYGSSAYEASQTGELIVVNRRGSRYGAGWSVGGEEQLYPGQRNGAVLLVDADGSAAVYEPIGTNVWLAPAGAYRDTLRYGSVSDGAVPAGTYYWRRLLDGTVIYYNGAGRQKWVVDRLGQKVEYGYTGAEGAGEALGYIRVAPYEENLRYTFGYDAGGKLESVTDPAGRVLRGTINASNQLVTLLEPDGVARVELTYDANQRLVTWRSPRGHTTTYGYHGSTGLLAWAWLPNGAQTVFTPVQRQGLALAARGNATQRAAEATVTIDGPRTDVADVVRFWVSRYGAPTQIQDPLGFTTRVAYDGAAPLLPTRVEWPDGRVVRLRYDASARLVWAEDSTHSAGRDSVTYRYGSSYARERPDLVVTPREAGKRDSTIYVFNANGTIQRIIGPRRDTTEFGYNARGQVTEVTSRGIPVWVSLSSPRQIRNLVTKLRYGNRLANLDTVITPLGHRSVLTYDAAGNVIGAVDAAGDTSRFYVNLATNRADSISRYDRQAGRWITAKFTYDLEGNRITHKGSPREGTRRWFYDVLGRDSVMRDELGNEELRRYDPAGNLVLFRNRQGDSVRTEYDAAGRVLRQILGAVRVDDTFESSIYRVPVGTILVPGDTITFQYDPVGRPKVVENRHARVSRTYTKEGALLSETDSLKWLGRKFVKSYTYERSGARKTLTTPGGRVFTYFHGPGGVLDSIRVSTGGTVVMRWDKLGRRDSIFLPKMGTMANGVWTVSRYDAEGRIRQVYAWHPAPGFQWPNRPLLDLRWTDYDPVGRPRRMEDWSHYAQTADGYYTLWEYDGRGQLKRIYRYAGDPGTNEATYVYDESGNRIFETRLGFDSIRYVIRDSTNQILARVEYELFPYIGLTIATELYSYDKAGQLVADSLVGRRVTETVLADRMLRYFYDALGRLAGGTYRWRTYTSAGTVDTAQDTIHSRYDGLGRLISRHLPKKGQWYFIYDGPNVLSVGNLEILHGGGVDDPLIMFPSGPGALCSEPAAYFQTHQGRFFYFHGAETGQDCTGMVPEWQFSGAIVRSDGFDLSRQGEDKTELAYFRNRWYDANTGRFTQEDPIGFAGGMNLYAYSGNNPASYTDPFGLCPEPQNKNGTVCLALFIRRESVLGLKGDGRDFSSSSDPSLSRVWVHVDPANRTYSARILHVVPEV